MKRQNYYDKTHMERYNNEGRALEHRECQAMTLIEKWQPAEGSKYIDIGCGDGLFLHAVSVKFGPELSYFGCEYSEHQREKAIARTGFSISHADLEEGLSFENSTFDLAYSGEVIEHLYNPDLMLIEMNRILKVGGGLIITTPNLNSWVSRVLFPFGFQPINYECSTVSSTYGYRWLKKLKRQNWPVGHIRLFNRYSLEDLVRANGFEIIATKGAVFEHIPRPLRTLDKLFSHFPSLASGVLILARKIR